MYGSLLAVLLAVGVSSCSLFQGDEEELEVSTNTANNAINNNIGNQELALGQEEGMVNEGFDNQVGAEDSSVAEENPLLNNEDTIVNTAPNTEGEGMMPAADYGGGEGGVVRYTVGQTSVYAQPDSSAAPVRTLPQGEVLLVTIAGEFAQSAFGFIAISDLSAALQPRAFMGNDWQ